VGWPCQRCAISLERYRPYTATDRRSAAAVAGPPSFRHPELIVASRAFQKLPQNPAMTRRAALNRYLRNTSDQCSGALHRGAGSIPVVLALAFATALSDLASGYSVVMRIGRWDEEQLGSLCIGCHLVCCRLWCSSRVFAFSPAPVPSAGCSDALTEQHNYDVIRPSHFSDLFLSGPASQRTRRMACICSAPSYCRRENIDSNDEHCLRTASVCVIKKGLGHQCASSAGLGVSGSIPRLMPIPDGPEDWES
jgi:hypothetical protein